MKIVAATIITTLSIYANSPLNLSPVYESLTNGDYEQAIIQLDNIKSADKAFLGTKAFLKGLSYSKIQEFDKAVLEFKRSISYNNQSGEVFYELGQALYAINDLELSRKSFLRASDKNFKKTQSLYYIGHISQLLEEHKNAKTNFQKILKEKEASDELRQIARFQMAESMLHLARTSPKSLQLVESYILPQFRVALKEDEKSQTARDISKRISEIENEFGLNPNLLKNGRPIPEKKYSLNFSQMLSYDNNFTLTSELPESSQTKADTFVTTTELNMEYTLVGARRFLFRPYLTLLKTSHSERSNSLIYASDANNITAGLKNSYEHKAFGNPASLLFNYAYNYNAEDREAKKEIIFNDRSQSFEIGERFKFFSFGETSIKYKIKYTTSFTETSDFDTTSFSLDQVYIKDKYLVIFLFINSSSTYINDETNNTNSTTLRLDYLRPNVFPKTMLNLGASATLLNYDDEEKSELRGTEKTYSYNLKFSRDIRNFLSCDLEYIYTQNKSLVEESNYSKHETMVKLNLSL